MKAPRLLHSGFVHAANLTTGVLIMLSCVYFFGWELYGQVSLVIALSLLATQIVVLGNPSLMVASLTNSQLKYHNSIFKTFNRYLFKPHMVVLTLLSSLILYMEFSATEYFSNLSIFSLIAITSSTLLAPYNKMIMSSLTLPDKYSRFVTMTLVRNITIISFLGASVVLDSRIGMLFIVALTELVIFPLLLILRWIMNTTQSGVVQIQSGDNSRRDRTSAFFITLYFELLGKYDFYILSFFMTPKTFGIYALISNVNESVQTYLGTVRTQVTPYFTKHKPSNLKDIPETLFHVRLVLTILVGLGFTFVYIIFLGENEKLNSWPIYFVLILISTLVMFKSLVYGNVYVQKGEVTKFARMGAMHLGVLTIGFSLVCLYFGSIPALILSICVNFMFSWFIYRGISRVGKLN